MKLVGHKIYCTKVQFSVKFWLKPKSYATPEIPSTSTCLVTSGPQLQKKILINPFKKIRDDDGASADNLAQALHDYAALAGGLRERLSGIGGFDVALIDEAETLSAALGAVGQGKAPSEKALAAKLLRDQMASLLQDKMRLARAAVDFVLRAQPKLARQAHSAYARRRRADAKRRATHNAPTA